MAEKSIKARLSAMSDGELYSVISAVCAAARLEPERARALTGDIPRLRRMLEALSDRQISSLIASLGEADASEMLRRLGGKNN